MSTDIPPSSPPRLEARELRTRWPGLVWAAPLAAIVIVLYLALNAVADRGVDIVVSFSKSAGARAGDTPVVYKGVKVGRVVKIQISPDARRVRPPPEAASRRLNLDGWGPDRNLRRSWPQNAAPEG